MAPQTLGRYEIIDELGKGAMGLVYLARDPLIGRQLAIKTFNVGLSAGDQELEQFKARFLREAQSAGILNHPNIVTIHDVMVADDGAVFIAMEYVKGTDLKILMQRQDRLDPKFVVDVVAQIADGLEYAHSKGVVHRDIKPANVIITSEKQAKITDFGIAHLDTSNLTTEGQLLGTPNYMSPEMIRGQTVDHRADIFSLGVMLYEMLTSKKPFHGSNLTVVTHKIVYEPFTPPDEIIAGLPPSLMQVLDRALAKEPDERCADAGEMAADLRQVFAPASSRRSPMARVPASGSFLVDELAPRPQPISTASAPAFHAGPAAAGSTDTTVAAAGVAPRPPSSPAAEPASSRTSSSTPWIAGGALAALLAVAGIVFVAMRGGREEAAAGAPPPPDPVVETQAEHEPHVAEGRRLLADGDPRGAVAAFDRALAIAPADREIRQLRQQAEDEALRLEGVDPDTIVVQRRIAEGRQALEARDYAAAKRLAEEALARDAGNRTAKALLAEAEEGQKRKDQVRDRFRPGGVDEKVAETPPPTAAAVRQSTLRIVFHSEIAEGRITIYAEQDRLYQESFKFAGKPKSGFFSRSSGEPVSGELTATSKTAAGPTKLLVYVKPKDFDKTSSARVDADLPADGTMTLNVELNKDGRITASVSPAS